MYEHMHGVLTCACAHRERVGMRGHGCVLMYVDMQAQTGRESVCSDVHAQGVCAQITRRRGAPALFGLGDWAPERSGTGWMEVVSVCPVAGLPTPT